MTYYLHGAEGDDTRFNAWYGDLLRGYQSIGGYGVMSYAALHPDLFAAAVSPVRLPRQQLRARDHDHHRGPAAQRRPAGSDLRAAQHRARPLAGHIPTDLAGNLRDVILRVTTAGGTPAPAEGSPLNPGELGDCVVEGAIHQTNLDFERQLNALGIPHEWTDYGAGCHTIWNFRRQFTAALPLLAHVFAHPQPTPPTFGFKTIQPDFTVRRWQIAADPKRALEFMQIENAGAGGITLTGSGITHVVTPVVRRRARRRRHDLRRNPDRHAGPHGRLAFAVNLGPLHQNQEYTPAADLAGENGAAYFTTRTVTFATIRNHRLRRAVAALNCIRSGQSAMALSSCAPFACRGAGYACGTNVSENGVVMPDTEKIAFLGAGGMMGFAMARNLARAGFEVRAWNRSREKAEPLTQDGVHVADTPAQAADGATIILTMLADGEAVRGSIEGDDGAFSATHGDGVVWLQMSTVGEAATEQFIELAVERGIAFVDAPVLGTKEPAEAGELIVMASGPERLHDRLEPILDAVGKRTMWVGGAGNGSRLKLATNSWILAVVEGGAETFALAEGLGLDPQLVLDAIEGGPLDLPYLRMKGKAMIERRFEPSFKLVLATKDARLVEEAMLRHDLELPLVRTIRERMEEAVPEHGDEDMSATFRTSAPAHTAA